MQNHVISERKESHSTECVQTEEHCYMFGDICHECDKKAQERLIWPLKCDNVFRHHLL